MKVRDFFFAVLLLIIAVVLFYLVTPRYYFYISPSLSGIVRGNRVTGVLEVFTGAQWKKLGAHGAEGAKGNGH